METTEFKQKLHEYMARLDPSTFINAFTDANKKHGDNLELIFQDMKQSEIDYHSRMNEYVLAHSKNKKA